MNDQKDDHKPLKEDLVAGGVKVIKFALGWEQITSRYPMEDIRSEMAAGYLIQIMCDVFNDDIKLEDLEELQLHLEQYIKGLKRIQDLTGPYVSPGGHY